MQLARPALASAPLARQATLARPDATAPTTSAPALHGKLAQTLTWYAPWRISRTGLALVVLGHGLLLWWLMHYVTTASKPVVPVLSVSLLTAPSEPPPEPTPPQVEPQPPVKPQPRPVKPRPTPPLLSSHQATPTPDSPAPQPEPTPAPEPAPVAAPPAPPAPAAPVVAKPQPPRFDAAYLDNPRPAYPLLSRRMGEQGKVLLLVDVDAQGKPTNVQLHHSSGSSRLDNAAIEAVRRWRFVAARRGDTAIAASVIVPIDFSLKD